MARGSNRLELTWYNKDQALIPAEEGRYDYRWTDPRDPRAWEVRPLVEDTEITGTRAEKAADGSYSPLADLDPTEDNLAVLGESGEVLRALTGQPELADKYLGQVKLCYIDPPFNTGELFDHYDDALEHSVWLGLMRDRLVDIKKLLSEDGSVWVHLNDDENHRMRMLLDEIFGPDNFVAEVQWEKTYKPRNDARGFSSRRDSISVYQKSPQFSLNKLPRTAAMDANYTNPDDDPRGDWIAVPSNAPDAIGNQPMVYAIQHPVTGTLLYPPASRCWGVQQGALLRIMKEWGRYELVDLDDASERARVCGLTSENVKPGVKGIVIPDWGPEDAEFARNRYAERSWPEFYFTGGGLKGLSRKSYLSDKGGRVPEDFWGHIEVGSNDAAKREIKALFPGTHPFDTPKPERLLERIIHIASNPGDLVMDIFAGSGTTAAVAHKMGRRWITAELSEKNFTTFTVPRLTKVVTGTDPGGITQVAGERTYKAPEAAPEGLAAEDAAAALSAISKATKGTDLATEAAIKELRRRLATTPGKPVMNWLGGGSFRTAHLAPAILDHDEDLDMTFLAESAEDHDTLIAAVAANLGFRRDTAPPGWHGRDRARLLFVADGVFTVDTATDLLDRLPEDTVIVVAAVAAEPEAVGHIRTHGPRGSRTVLLPDGLRR